MVVKKFLNFRGDNGWNSTGLNLTAGDHLTIFRTSDDIAIPPVTPPTVHSGNVSATGIHNTGIQVKAGQKLTITASGKWRWKRPPWYQYFQFNEPSGSEENTIYGSGSFQRISSGSAGNYVSGSGWEDSYDGGQKLRIKRSFSTKFYITAIQITYSATLGTGSNYPNVSQSIRLYKDGVEVHAINWSPEGGTDITRTFPVSPAKEINALDVRIWASDNNSTSGSVTLKRLAIVGEGVNPVGATPDTYLVGFEGDASRSTNSGFPINDGVTPPYSLIGRLGTTGTWFPLVSNTVHTVSPTDDGKTLYLAMNDDDYTNNSGSLAYEVQVNGRSSSPYCGTPLVTGADDLLVARIGGGTAFIVGKHYEGTVPAGGGALQLAANGCLNKNVSAQIIINAPPPCENDGTCEEGSNYQEKRGPNPIVLRTANKVLSQTDLTMQSPAQALAFTRSYSQDRQGDSSYQFMGLGWSHNHRYLLTLTGSSPDQVAEIALPSGGVLILDEDSTGHLIARPGSTSVLDHDTVNDEYILTTQNKTTFVFEDTAPYLLKRRTWPNDEEWTYTYDGNDNLILVEDGYGRELNFTYYSGETGDNAFKNGQLKTISDHSTPARTVTLDYLPEKDDGTTVSTPKALLSGVTDVRGKVWAYDYYGQHSGESTDGLLNLLTKRESPDIQLGTDDGYITLEELAYTLSGSDISAINQKRGNVLLETDYAFQPGSVNVTEETMAGQTTIHHFARGVYAGTADPDGNVPVQVIEDDYRPTEQADANGNSTELTWTNDGQRLTMVTDALNHETEFDYNSNDTLNFSLDAQGRKTTYTYGDVNNPRQPTIIKVLDTNGTTVLRWQEFTYDSKGRTTEERLIDPANGTTVLQKTTRSYYTSGAGNGLLETLTQVDVNNSANNTSTTYTYDSAGRVVKTQKTSLFGNCEFSYMVYDLAGNMLATVCGRENTSIPTSVAAARDMYDPGDPAKFHVTTHEYDEMGRRISTTVNDGDPTPDFAQTTLTAYDALNRVIRTVSNYNASSAGVANPYTAAHSAFGHGTHDNENLVTDTFYNARGMVRKQVDMLGNVMLYGYDEAGRLVKTIQAAATPNYNNDYVGTSPDPDLSAYSPVSDVDQDLISQQVYDPAGNLVQTIDPLGRVIFTVYDELNRPKRVVRSAKSSATVSVNSGDSGYNKLNDPRSNDYLPSTEPDRDLIEETTYDTMGRVQQTRRLMEDRTGTKVWNITYFVYDSLGRQVRTIQNYVAQGATDPSTWVWDATDNRWETSTGTAIAHNSDAANGKVNDINLISTTVYDTEGRVLYPEDVNRSKTYQVYDGLGRQVKTIANYVVQGSSDPANWLWDTTDNRWEDGATNAIAFGTQNDQNIIAETVYDSNGRVLTTRDILGRQTYNVYDVNGRSIRRIANYVAQGASNPANWVWDATDNRWEDGAGNAIDRGTHDDQNIITDTVYDDEGRVQQTIDVRRNVSYTVYDKLGRRVTSITNYIVQGSSDPADWVWDAAQSRWEDGANNAISRGTNKDQNVISTTEYDLAGRVSNTRDVAGNETRYEYDDLGRRVKTIANYVNGAYTAAEPDKDLISTTAYNKGGQVVETVDARGTKTHFIYDDAGRRLTITRAAETDLETTDYTCYDKAGRVLRTIRSWDGTGDPDAQTSGNWTFAPTDHGQLNDRNLSTEFAYDAASRRISTTDPEGNVSETAYFKDGQVDTLTDPEGTVTAYRYDGLRRRRMVVQGYVANAQDPGLWVWDAGQTRWETSTGTAIVHGTNNDQNVIVQVAHDVAGRMTSLRDPRGNQTTYLYDQLNRRTRLTNPLTTQWNTSYEDLTNGGTRTTLNYPGLGSGGSYDVTREFDRLGRLSSLTYGSPTTTPDVVFTYDDAGNRAKMSEYSGAGFTSKSRETSFSYDAARRLTQVDFDTDGDNDVDQSVAYEYDAGGLRTKLTLPGSLDVEYFYDDKGRLIGMNDWDGQHTAFGYDEADRHVATERDNGLKTDYLYTSAGRLRRMRHFAGELNSLRGHFEYTLDERGNRTQAFERLAQSTTVSATYGKSAAEVSYPAGTWTDEGSFKKSTQFSAKMEIDYTADEALLTIGTDDDHGIFDIYIDGGFWNSFDGYSETPGERVLHLPAVNSLLEIRNRNARNLHSIGNVIRFKQLEALTVTYDERTIDYTYDALSRLLEADYNSGTTVYNYGFDLAGNMTKLDSVTRTYNAANQLTNDGTNALVYDANGNLWKVNTVEQYTWDRANRLLSHGGIDYAYEGLGNRISQDNGTNVTQYLLDVQPGLVKVLAATTGVNTERYIHSIRGIHAQENQAGNWTWMTQDGLGSVRSIIDSVLQVDAVQSYDPIGNPDGSYAPGFGFTGEQTDANDQVYLRARYYNPSIGVFNSLDPFKGTMDRPMSLNEYSWVEGQVINLVDPSGLCGGSFCHPEELTASDYECWSETLDLYKQFGIVIAGKWTTQQVKVLKSTMQDVANSLASIGSRTNANGIFRHHIGHKHPIFRIRKAWSILEDPTDQNSSGSMDITNSNQINIMNWVLDDHWKWVIVHELGHYMANHHILGFSYGDYMDHIGATCNLDLLGECIGDYQPGQEAPVSIYARTDQREDFAEAWALFVTNRAQLQTQHILRDSYFLLSISNTWMKDLGTTTEFVFDEWFDNYHRLNGCNIACGLAGMCGVSKFDKNKLAQEWLDQFCC